MFYVSTTFGEKTEIKQDLLDLITAHLKFNCSVSTTTVAAQCSFQSSL